MMRIAILIAFLMPTLAPGQFVGSKVARPQTLARPISSDPNRRSIVAGLAAIPMVTIMNPVMDQAKAEIQAGSDSPFVAELLKRSKANKKANDAERLQEANLDSRRFSINLYKAEDSKFGKDKTGEGYAFREAFGNFDVERGKKQNRWPSIAKAISAPKASKKPAEDAPAQALLAEEADSNLTDFYTPGLCALAFSMFLLMLTGLKQVCNLQKQHFDEPLLS